MKLTPKIASITLSVLALGGAGIGTAVASSASAHAPAGARAAQSEPASPDNDVIQQGDQTSPDNAAASVRAVHAQSSKAENPGEESGSENGPSDGPGGHADPSGNVQHEFNGVE